MITNDLQEYFTIPNFHETSRSLLCEKFSFVTIPILPCLICTPFPTYTLGSSTVSVWHWNLYLIYYSTISHSSALQALENMKRIRHKDWFSSSTIWPILFVWIFSWSLPTLKDLQPQVGHSSRLFPYTLNLFQSMTMDYVIREWEVEIFIEYALRV